MAAAPANIQHVCFINGGRFTVDFRKEDNKFLLQQSGKPEPCVLSLQQMRRLCESAMHIQEQADAMRASVEADVRTYAPVDIHLGGLNYLSIKYHRGQCIDIREVYRYSDNWDNLVRSHKGIHLQRREGDFKDFFVQLGAIYSMYKQCMDQCPEVCGHRDPPGMIVCPVCNPYPGFPLAPDEESEKWDSKFGAK